MVREIERMTPFVLLLILSTKPQAEKHVILKKKFPKHRHLAQLAVWRKVPPSAGVAKCRAPPTGLVPVIDNYKVISSKIVITNFGEEL